MDTKFTDPLADFSKKDLRANCTRNDVLMKTTQASINPEMKRFQQSVVELEKMGIVLNIDTKIRSKEDMSRGLEHEIKGRENEKSEVKSNFKPVMVFEGIKFRMANLDDQRDREKIKGGQDFARIEMKQGQPPRFHVVNEATRQKVLNMTYEHEGKEFRLTHEHVVLMDDSEKNIFKQKTERFEQLNFEIQQLQIQRDQLIKFFHEQEAQKKENRQNHQPTANRSSTPATDSHVKFSQTPKKKEQVNPVEEKNSKSVDGSSPKEQQKEIQKDGQLRGTVEAHNEKIQDDHSQEIKRDIKVKNDNHAIRDEDIKQQEKA